MKKILGDIATLLEINGIKTSSYDVADMLWLGAIMDEHSHSISLENQNKEDLKEDNKLNEKDSSTKPQENNDNVILNEEDKPVDTPASPSNPIYLNQEQSKGRKKGEYKKLPTPRLYTQYNQFANVLKILRQQSLSQTEKVLDEDSTIEYIANTHIWNVLTKPKREKKFTLNIIIEKSDSMEVWEEITSNFSSTVASFLFFKALNIYYLKDFVLYSDKQCKNKVSVNIFHSHEEKYLTILMSDCVSSGWGYKSGYDFLKSITEITPFMILNMLPQRIWKRTIIDDTWRIKFTHKEGWLNKFLISDIDEEECQVSKEHVRVPMTTFDTISLKHWSNLIAGEKENCLYGSLFEAEWFSGAPKVTNDSRENEDPVQLVKDFEIFASPMAQKLAIYFSTVPLSMDIMKIVQKVSLPESNHTHLAEVFLSGLLKKTTLRTPSRKIIYKFVNGVRDILRDKLYLHKKIDILKENTTFISKNLGSTIDFIALIENPSSLDGMTLSDDNEIMFGEIIADVFNEMKEEYSESTNQVQTKSTDSEGLPFLKKLPSDYIEKILSTNVIKYNNKTPFKLLLLYKGNSLLSYQDTIFTTISHTFQRQNWHVDTRMLNDDFSFEEQLEKYKDITVDDCIFYYIGDATLTKEDELLLTSNDIKVSFASKLKNIYTKFNNCNIAGVIDTCFYGNNTLNNINDDIELFIFNSSENESYRYEASSYFCEAMNSSVDIVTLPYVREYINSRDKIGGYVLDRYTKHDFSQNILLVDKTGSEQILFEYQHEINNRVYTELLLNKIPKALVTLEREKHLAEYLKNIPEYFINYLEKTYLRKKDDIWTTEILDISKDKHIEIIMMTINILSTDSERYLRKKFIDKLYAYISAPASKATFDDRPLLYSLDCLSIILPKHNKWLFNFLEKISYYAVNYFQSQASLEFDSTGRIKVYFFIKIIDTLIKTELNVKDIPSDIFDFIEKLKKNAISAPEQEIEKRNLYKHYYEVDYMNLDKELTLKEILYMEKLKQPSLVFERKLEPKILWVDDRPENNTRERKIFEKEGISFDLVYSTDEALDKIKSNDYIVIISDMDRKEGDKEGYVLLKKLRDSNNQTPFFIYAGSNLQEHKDMARMKGAQGSTNNGNELFEMVMNYVDKQTINDTSSIIHIPKGKFIMGDHKNKKSVTIDYEFEIGKYPVTVGDFRVFIQSSGYVTEVEDGAGAEIWDGRNYEHKNDVYWDNPYFEQTDDHPVVFVSYRDMLVYIEWLNTKAIGNYRLPTEAEWEYVCRAGSTTKWSFGDDRELLNQYAWHNKNSNKHTHPIGRKAPNPWGIHDMHGNVWERCSDDWNETYDNTPTNGSAYKDKKGNIKIVRGGSWVDEESTTTSFFRNRKFIEAITGYIGFRLVRTIDNNIKSDITYQCKSCEASHTLDCKELDWEQVGGSERGMGAELEHEAEYFDTCEKCDNDMSITFRCWEYPVGAENMREISSSGVINLKGDCCKDFHVLDEESRNDYAPSEIEKDHNLLIIDTNLKHWHTIKKSFENKGFNPNRVYPHENELEGFIEDIQTLVERNKILDLSSYIVNIISNFNIHALIIEPILSDEEINHPNDAIGSKLIAELETIDEYKKLPILVLSQIRKYAMVDNLIVSDNILLVEKPYTMNLIEMDDVLDEDIINDLDDSIIRYLEFKEKKNILQENIPQNIKENLQDNNKLLKCIKNAFKDYNVPYDSLPQGVYESRIANLAVMSGSIEFKNIVRDKDTFILNIEFEPEAYVYNLMDKYYVIGLESPKDHNKQTYNTSGEARLFIKMSIVCKIDDNEQMVDFSIDSIDDVVFLKNEHSDKREQDIKDKISDDITSILKNEHLKGLDYFQIHDESLPSDDHSALINSYDLPKKIDIKNIIIFSNQFTIKIYFEQEVYLDIHILKSEYYSNDEYVSLYGAVEDLNKHYVSVECHAIIAVELGIQGTRDKDIHSIEDLDIDIVDITVVEQIPMNENIDNESMQEIKDWFLDNYKKTNAFPVRFPIKFGEKDLQNYEDMKETILAQFEERYTTDVIMQAIIDIREEYGEIAWAKKSFLRVETKDGKIKDIDGDSYKEYVNSVLDTKIHVPANGKVYEFEVNDMHYDIKISKISEQTMNESQATREMVTTIGATHQGTIKFKDNQQGNIEELNRLIGENFSKEYGLAFYSIIDDEQEKEDYIDFIQAESDMEGWFSENYDDPVNFLPYDSEEDRFQYLYGGPYELDEILYEEFDGKYPNEYIKQVIEGLRDQHGDVDWAKKPDEKNSDYAEKGYVEDGYFKSDEHGDVLCKICKNTLKKEYTDDGVESWHVCTNKKCEMYDIMVGLKYGSSIFE